jgi:hypothetical protein
MKLQKIFEGSTAGSTTTTGSAVSARIPIVDGQTAVVQFSSDSIAPGDIALQGRLTDHPTLTTWSEITLMANGAIQVIPRCLEYRVVVTNTAVTTINTAVWVGA